MFPVGALDSWAASQPSRPLFQMAVGAYTMWRGSVEAVPDGLPVTVLDPWSAQPFNNRQDTRAKAAYLRWRPLRSDPPQPCIRWSLRSRSEGWTAGPNATSTVVSHDSTGWLMGSGTGKVELASPRNKADWSLPDRTTAGRISVSARIDGPRGSKAVVSMGWLPDGASAPRVVDSFAWTVPVGLEIDLDTWLGCRGAVPDDVLRRIHSIRVRAIAPSSTDAITVRIRDVRQAASTKPYGPDATGVGTQFFAEAPNDLPAPEPQDGYQAAVLAKVAALKAWSQTNSRAVHIGEWGWPKEVAGQKPGADPSQVAYSGMAEQWMRQVDRHAIPYTPWGESAYWAGSVVGGVSNYGSYPMANYYCGGGYNYGTGVARPIGAMKPSAQLLEDHMGRVPAIKPSINLVGMCFVYLRDGTQFSNTNIGNRGTDYRVENPDSIAYLYSRGYRTFRLPFRWDRVMRDPEGELDPSEWGYVRQAIDAILAYPDTAVIVDQHSSAEYWISENPADKKVAAVRHTVDGSTKRITTDHYVHLWNLLSDDLVEHSDRLIYEITNEPHDSNAFIVKRYTQAVVSALRARGDNTFCFIPSYPYDNITAAFAEYNQPFPWIVDPAGSRRHAYTLHHYMDWDQSGSYAASYAATAAKYPPLPPG